MCKKLIKDSDIRITLNGYTVYQNAESNKIPKGFTVVKPEDFCSFDCLSTWALQNKKILDEYKNVTKKYYGEDNNE